MDIDFPVVRITPLIRTTVVPISGVIGTTVVRIASVVNIGNSLEKEKNKTNLSFLRKKKACRISVYFQCMVYCSAESFSGCNPNIKASVHYRACRTNTLYKVANDRLVTSDQSAFGNRLFIPKTATLVALWLRALIFH